MGVAPDFSAEIDGREDSRGVYPDVVEDVSAEGSDKGKGMGIKIRDAGDIAKEVPFDELLLRDPKFLTVVVDDGVLVWVPVGNKGAGRCGKEVGKDIG